MTPLSTVWVPVSGIVMVPEATTFTLIRCGANSTASCLPNISMPALATRPWMEIHGASLTGGRGVLPWRESLDSTIDVYTFVNWLGRAVSLEVLPERRP